MEKTATIVKTEDGDSRPYQLKVSTDTDDVVALRWKLIDVVITGEVTHGKAGELLLKTSDEDSFNRAVHMLEKTGFVIEHPR